MPLFHAIWHHLAETQSLPAHSLTVGAAVVALVVITPDWSWRVCRNGLTIAHEGGHAVVALATGRRLTGLRLHSDTSGVTVSVGRPTGPGMILTAFAGYAAPPLLGLGAAYLLSSGHVAALLWVAVLLLAGMLVMVRNAFGVLSVVCTALLVGYVCWSAPATVQAVFGCFTAWFLVLAGGRSIVELQRQRRRGRGANSDADQLARLTRVPGLCWVATFGLIDVGALLLSVDLYLR